jgi:hypothetical protein
MLAANGLSKTDSDSGTFVFYGAGGVIDDFGADDYYNLTIDSSGQTFTLGSSLSVNGKPRGERGHDRSGRCNRVHRRRLIHRFRRAGSRRYGYGDHRRKRRRIGTPRGGERRHHDRDDFLVDSYNATSNVSGTTVGGSWGVSVFAPGTGLVTFAGTGTITAETFHDLAVSSAASVAASGAIVVEGDLTVTGSLSMGTKNLTVSGAVGGTGTLSASSGTITVSGDFGVSNYAATSGVTSVGGDWSVGGTFTPGTGTVTFNGDGFRPEPEYCVHEPDDRGRRGSRHRRV